MEPSRAFKEPLERAARAPFPRCAQVRLLKIVRVEEDLLSHPLSFGSASGISRRNCKGLRLPCLQVRAVRGILELFGGNARPLLLLRGCSLACKVFGDVRILSDQILTFSTY